MKEKVNAWIHCQLESFLEKWVPPDQSHPALESVRRLGNSVERLSLSSSDYLQALQVCLCVVYTAILFSGFFFRSAKYLFRAEITDFRLSYFRLLHTHMHHTPSRINIRVEKYLF